MEYVWLSIYVNLDYLVYSKLLSVFKSVKEIYIKSKDKNNFLKILKINKVYISYKIFSNLVNKSLKVKSINLYKKLIQDNIKIITIDSKYYPKNLIFVFNPPLVLFAYGDISLLSKNKIYVYNSNTFSNLGKIIYNDFTRYLNDNDICIVSDSITRYTNIIYLPYIQKINRGDFLILSDKVEKSLVINYECITGISDCLFLPEASYNIKIVTIVDLMLEQGKDILVVPGNIYNKKSYFSNYLIKDGAFCVTSKRDLLNYFK